MSPGVVLVLLLVVVLLEAKAAQASTTTASSGYVIRILSTGTTITRVLLLPGTLLHLQSCTVPVLLVSTDHQLLFCLMFGVKRQFQNHEHVRKF